MPLTGFGTDTDTHGPPPPPENPHARLPSTGSKSKLTTTSASFVDVNGRYIYAVGRGGSVEIFEAIGHDPANVVSRGSDDGTITTEVTDVGFVEARGWVLFIGEQDGGISTVDVSDPTTPTLINQNQLAATIGAGHQHWGILPNGDYLFTNSDGTVYAVNLADPSNLVIDGSMAMSRAGEVDAIGDTTIIVEGDGLRVLDVSDPANMAEIGSLTNLNHRSLRVLRSGLAVGDTWGGLETYDISDPTNPSLIATVSLGTGFQSGQIHATRGEYLFWAGNPADGPRTHFIDISNPANPTPRWMFTDAGLMSDLNMAAVDGQIVALADEGQGSVYVF